MVEHNLKYRAGAKKLQSKFEKGRKRLKEAVMRLPCSLTVSTVSHA